MSVSLLFIIVAYNTFLNVCFQLPLRLPKMQHQKSLTRRWLSTSGWGWEGFSVVSDYEGVQRIRKGQWCTRVNIVRLAIGYLNATRNGNTWKRELGIRTVGSSQTRHYPQVDGYWSALGPPRRSGLCCWTGLELNRTDVVVRTWTASRLPALIANTIPIRQIIVGQCDIIVWHWTMLNNTIQPNQS